MNPSNDVTVSEIRAARSAIMAGMETGNIGYARTTLEEFAALFPEAAKNISIDVAAAYGTVLL